MSLTSGTARQILEHLDTLLTGLGLTDWKKKLISLGTDGASVNQRVVLVSSLKEVHYN